MQRVTSKLTSKFQATIPKEVRSTLHLTSHDQIVYEITDNNEVLLKKATPLDFDYLQAFSADGGCATLQIDYSILNRTPEADIFPYCQKQNIGVIVRGPLAMGLLTGKFGPDTEFDEGDFRRRWQENPDERETYLQDLAKVEQLRSLAEGRMSASTPARTLAQLALQFVMTHPAVTVVIPGAKTGAQLRDNVGAALLPPLTSQEVARIDAVTPPGGGRKIWPA